MSVMVFLKNKDLNTSTAVDNVFIKRFMPLAPELAVKAYLYGLMLLSSSSSEDNDLALALGCSDEDIKAAFHYWQSAGIVRIISYEPLQVQYLSADKAVNKLLDPDSDSEYAGFILKLQSVLGTRMLTGAELSKIYDWLEVFGFEQDAALEIVRCSLDKKGVKASVSYMDSVAKRLAEKGCFTYDNVASALAEEEAAAVNAAKILKRWHLHRPLTEDELALYKKWTGDWGFDEKLIDLALEKMITASKPSFAYLDKILNGWHEEGTAGAFNAEEIKKHDDAVFELTRQACKRAGIKSRPGAEYRLTVREWLDEWHMSAELILLAADYAKESSKPFASMRSIVSEWHEHGISGIREASEYYENNQRFKSNSSNKKNSSGKYIKGKEYSRDDLKKLGISLDIGGDK